MLEIVLATEAVNPAETMRADVTTQGTLDVMETIGRLPAGADVMMAARLLGTMAGTAAAKHPVIVVVIAAADLASETPA